MESLTTITYETDGPVARVTLNRPARGNGITLEMPRELAACVERANLDPGVRVIALAGNGPGFCGGYDLVASAEGRSDGLGASGAPAGSPLDPAVQAANHDPARVWDPMIDFQMMCAERPRVHEPLPLRQARRLQGPRLLRRRRHGHGALLRSAGGRGRSQDRLSTRARLGRPHHRALGLEDRAGAGQAAAPDGRLHLRGRGRRLGARRRGCAGRCARRALRGAARSGREGAHQPARHAQAARQPGPLRAGPPLHAGPRARCSTASRATPRGHAFAQRAAEAGWREAVRDRDEPFGDPGRSTFRG